ncbi:MAG: hypothetical protein PUH81_11010 [Clostridiales bacterium]|nr:hypothetical protein [Clostridiales bacterium]MDY5468278.1 hypothetical protein [Eubacteriales bacterium]
MKKSKRIALLAVSLALCLCLAASALAEGMLSTLFNAGCKLLFDTDNATLNAHATFSYDGELFKTFDGKYMQDGVNSYMNVSLQTPMKDGTVHEGGYTVISNDGVAYSMETARPKMYTTTSSSLSSSILSSTVLRQSLTNFGSALLNLMEGSMSRYISAEPSDSGTQYQIQLGSGDSPVIANATLTLFSQLAAQRFFGINYNLLSTDPEPVASGLIWEYEDWDGLFATIYRQQYGEELPKNFYEALWNSENPNSAAYYERYVVVNGLVDDVCTQLCNQYKSGVAVIHADGTHDYWATEDEYLVDTGKQTVLFEDSTASFMQYYQQKTGETLNQADMDAIYASNNPELYRAYQQMFNDMNLAYLAQVEADGKASAIYVSKNGETKMIYDIAAYNREQQSDNGYYVSVTARILNTMQSLKLDQTNVRVTLDAEGRILAGEGTVRIMVTDLYGVEHTLDIAFNATAGSYGSSEVETFDPEAYNVVSSQEYYENYEKYATITKGDQETPAPDSAEGDDSYKLPDTVTFNGVKYQVTLDESING